MHLYWTFIAPILPAIALFLGAVLIKDKKRVGLIFFGVLSMFNIYVIFNLVNIIRRDFNGNFSIFPLGSYLTYIITIDIVFLLFSFLVLLKFDLFRKNLFITRIQSFFYKFKKNIFKLDKFSNVLLSIFLLFCLFYVVGFLNLYIHEFGHAMAFILVGTYYKEIRIPFFFQGWASGYLTGGDPFLNLKSIIVSFGGLVSECIFAVIILIIFLWKKEKNNFTWLISIIVSMLFLNRVMLYFTFPQLLNIRSDVLSLVYAGFDPWAIFFSFLPFLIISFLLTFKLISRLYKTSLKNNKKFVLIYFLSLIIYIVILNILAAIDEFITPLVYLSFY